MDNSHRANQRTLLPHAPKPKPGPRPAKQQQQPPPQPKRRHNSSGRAEPSVIISRHPPPPPRKGFFENISPWHVAGAALAVAAVGTGVFMYSRYMVCSPDEVLVRTGMGIKSMSVTRKGLVWPFQQHRLISTLTKTYDFNLHNMSKGTHSSVYCTLHGPCLTPTVSHCARQARWSSTCPWCSLSSPSLQMDQRVT